MDKTLYIVQWNLGGLCGPYRVKWDGECGYYVSDCGNFLFDPVDCIKESLWQVSFRKKGDAKMFYEGCSFTRLWVTHTFRE